MKRLGLIALLLAMAVFGIEAILTVSRQRNLTLAFRTEGRRPIVIAPTPASGETPTPAPAGADTGSGSLLIAPEGAVIIDAQWDYRIGPRFPVTTVRAEVQNAAGEVVASDTFTITCGSDTMSCTGTKPLTLRFGLRNGEGSVQNWPVGSYTLTATRTYAAADTAILTTRTLIVAE